MTETRLPSPSEVREIVAQIEALTGLVASFEPSRFNIKATDSEEADYASLLGEIEQSFAMLRAAGFPLGHMNRHRTLKGYRAWAINRDGDWAGRRAAVLQPFQEVLSELEALEQTLRVGAVAPNEVLREMQQAMLRSDEVVVMAVSER